MPNQLTDAGLQVKTPMEIVDTLSQALQTIYGLDINLSQNTPDGQLLNIFAQAQSDVLELLVAAYNSFGVETAFGTVLDQRVALNGLARKAGTYTFQDIEITVDRALTLEGLGDEIANPDGTGFTVADDAGNQFILAADHAFIGAGSATLTFRAKNVGAVETVANSIQNQVTVTLGVTEVNNPTGASSIGEDEESDVDLKLRHARSFKLASTGPADAVEAAIQEVDDVTDAFVIENGTAAPVSGIGAHSIWAIVEGGSDQDIGQAIYSKKAPGCGMTGGETAVVARPNGSTFTAKFDRPILEDLYMAFTIVPKKAGVTFDLVLIKEQLTTALRYRLGQSANIGDIVVAMQTIAPLGVLTDLEVSDDGITPEQILAPTTYQHKFVVDPARIDITV